MLAGGDLDFVKDPDKGEITVYRKIREGTVTVSAPSNILDKYGSSATATAELKSFFGEKTFFTAKPICMSLHVVYQLRIRMTKIVSSISSLITGQLRMQFLLK